MTWQPIETAPKDGQVILICAGNAVASVYWDDEFTWVSTEDNLMAHIVHDDPTHWMPLPEPPPQQKNRQPES